MIKVRQANSLRKPTETALNEKLVNFHFLAVLLADDRQARVDGSIQIGRVD